MILSIVFKTVFVPPLFSELLVLRAPLNSLDALGAGMLLGFTIYTGNKLSVRFRTLFIAGLIASIVFYSMVTLKIISQPDIGLGWFAIQNLTVVWIATSLVFAAETMQLWPLKLLAWRPLVYLGKISYGIYLYHFMLIPYYPAIARFFGYQIKSPRESMWSFLFSSAVAICVAAISWHVIESPILSLKDRFSARPTATFANNLREDNQIHSV
jgi:peptidoglycan/LPS O-acetylase OafA/YrhL